MERTVQETTSTYFNNILKKRVTPIPIENIDSDLLAIFNTAIEEAFTDEADVVKRRIEYLIPYIIQNIDWTEYGVPLRGWQLRYYYQRDRFLKVTGLSYDKFSEHRPLIESIEDLGLDREPVFEFILFLCYYYQLRSDLKFSPIEQFEKLQNALAGEDSIAQMDVVVDGKHYKFNNSSFIKKMISAVDKASIKLPCMWFLLKPV